MKQDMESVMKKIIILATWCIVFFLGKVRPSKLPPMPVHQPSTYSLQDSHKAAFQQSAPPKLQIHASEQGLSGNQSEIRSQPVTFEQQDRQVRTAQKNKDGREEVALDAEASSEQQARSGVKPSDRSKLASGKNLSPEMGAIRGKKTSTESEKISHELEQQKIIELAESSELSSKSLSRVKTVIDNANKKYQEKIDEINNSSSSNEEKAAQIKIAKEKLSEKMNELHNNIKKASEQEKAERIKEAESVKSPKINKEEDHRLSIKNLENEEERLRKQYEDIGRSQNIGKNDETRENFYNYYSIEKSNLNDRLKEITKIATETKMPEEARLALEKIAREEHIKALQGTVDMHLSLQEAIKNKVEKERQANQQMAQQQAQYFQPTFQPQKQEQLFQPTFYPQQQMPHLQPFDYPHLRQQPVQPFHPQQEKPFQPTFQPKKQTSQETVDEVNEKITKNIDDLKKKKLVSKGDEKILMKKWNDLQRSYEKRARSVANSKYDQKTKDSQQRQLDADHARILSEFQEKLQTNPKSLLKKKSRLSRIKSVFKPKR